jgi:hypothetical protein
VTTAGRAGDHSSSESERDSDSEGGGGRGGAAVLQEVIGVCKRNIIDRIREYYLLPDPNDRFFSFFFSSPLRLRCR